MELFTLMGKLGLDASEFMEGVQESVKEAGGLQKALSKVGSVVVKGVSNLTSYGDAVDKSSRKLGLSAKTYQELGHAMEASGTNIDSLSTGMKNLNAYLQGTSGKKASDAFAKLGFTPQQLASMSSADEQLSSILSKLADMSDKSARADIAETLFGKNAGAAMSALLDEGSEGIEKLRQEAQDLGLVMSDEDIDAAVKAGDAMANLQASLDALLNNALTPLLPLISSVVTALTPAIEALAPLISDAADALTRIITSVLEYFGIDGSKEEADRKAAERSAANAEAGAGQQSAYEQYSNMFTGTVAQNGVNEFASVIASMMKTYGVDKETAKTWASNIYSAKFGETYTGVKFVEGQDFSAIINQTMAAMAKAAEQMSQVGDAAEGAKDSLDAQGDAADSAKDSLDDQASAADDAKKALDDQANSADSAAESLDTQAAAADSAASSSDSAASSADSAASSMGGLASAANHAASALNSVHAPAVDGSHAGGLDYVPYDGYRAELHKGERVLTASENASYSRGGSVSGNLASAIAAAVREGMRGATVEAVLDGQKITDNVSKRMARDLRTMRYAT